MTDLRRLVIGAEECVTTRRLGRTTYVNLDHAASTPPLAPALRALEEGSRWYANVHRGSGYKARHTTEQFEAARERLAAFVRADAASQACVFVRNATEGLNRLARRIPIPAGHVVIVTDMEHHSNDLPWRLVAPVVRVGVRPDGRVDEDELRETLRRQAGRVAVVAATAASNVTGFVNPVHRWAAWAHEAGARMVVDAAQLVPHRPLDLRPAQDPEHLDAVAFSGHKLYAPFGAGVLVAPRDVLGQGDPDQVGGGTVDAVGRDYVVWAGLPDREEAGTPVILGAIALAAAADAIEAAGWPAVVAHESELAGRAFAGLKDVAGVTVYGGCEPDPDRLGVIPFNFERVPHGKAAAILGDEWGIGTRSGCFCAHPYVQSLLGIDLAGAHALAARATAGQKRGLPGMVRASIGLSSSAQDIDRLVDAVSAIARGEHDDTYVEDAKGEWT